MRHIHKSSAFIAVILLLSTLAQAGDVVKVYFGPSTADDPNGVYRGLTEFIDTAKTSIVGSIHEIDMIPIAEALAKKARMGVKVRLVVEGKWYHGPKCQAVREVFEAAGIEVLPDTKNSGLMHNKFWVIDDTWVWTGSTNLTSTCLFYNPNNAIRIDDERVAMNFKAEFDEEAAGHFGKRASGASNTPHPIVQADQTVIKTYFSPEDEPIVHVVAEIEKATRTLDVMCFVFSSEDVSKAILKAHERGVKVRVLLDNTFRPVAATASWKFVPARELSAAGVTVRWDHERAKLHHKLIVIDSTTVVTGSMNLSANGAQQNDENTLIVTSPDVASKYVHEFDRLWGPSGRVSQVAEAEKIKGDDDGQQ